MDEERKQVAGISMKALLEAGVHFGHRRRVHNPKMNEYTYGFRNGVYIVDLSKTVSYLKKAMAFVRSVILSGEDIIFVSTSRKAKEIVKEVAIRSESYYMVERWLGGTLTNFDTVLKSVNTLNKLDEKCNSDTFKSLSKKESSRILRQLKKLKLYLGGVQMMDKLPGAIFIIDLFSEKIAAMEAKKLNIPVVAVCDTNCDPDLVDYVIPGNDDAVRSIRLFSNVIGDVIVEAKEELKKLAVNEQIVSSTNANTKDSEDNATEIGTDDPKLEKNAKPSDVAVEDVVKKSVRLKNSGSLEAKQPDTDQNVESNVSL